MASKKHSTDSGTGYVIPEEEPLYKATRNEENLKHPQPRRPYGETTERIEDAAKRKELLQDALLREDEMLRTQFEQMAVGSTSQPYGQSSSGRGGGYGGHSRHGSQPGSKRCGAPGQSQAYSQAYGGSQGQRGSYSPRGGYYQPPGPGGGY